MFTFIDLFAGIGGIRIAFDSIKGSNCIFSSEFNKYSQITYKAFFKKSPDFQDIKKVDPPGDITQLEPHLIPDHDILTAGFPCQPFSLAGVSKKQSMGKPHGFNDPTQGTLFFNIKSIIQEKQPKAFLLENVKNITTHNNGNTFSIINKTLNDLGYNVFYRVIDASGWLPQHRERIYIVGFRRKDKTQNWEISNFPEFMALSAPVSGALSLTEIMEKEVPEKYTLGKGTWEALRRHKERHLSKGQGFGYTLIEPPFKNKITRTLSARYYKDGAEILIKQEGKRPRRLTPFECCKLMGFPENFQELFARLSDIPQPVSDNQAYKQFGNSVAVPVVTDIAKLMVQKLLDANAISEYDRE